MNYKAAIEAILFTMGESVELGRIADAIQLNEKETKKLLDELIKEYRSSSNIGMNIIELDGAYQMCTKPQMYEYLIRIAKHPLLRLLCSHSISSGIPVFSDFFVQNIRAKKRSVTSGDSSPDREARFTRFLRCNTVPGRSTVRNTFHPAPPAVPHGFPAGRPRRGRTRRSHHRTCRRTAGG